MQLSRCCLAPESVSECVGLDVEDVDFKNDAIRVVRKGGSEMMIYFGDEVEQALLNYLEDRAAITPVAGHEHALFYLPNENGLVYKP